MIRGDARWPAIRKSGLDSQAKPREAGGQVDVVSLPERDLRGNSRMTRMDRDNREAAAVVQEWLAAKGPWR